MDVSETASETIELCSVEDVPDKGGLRVELDGLPALAVFRIADRHFVIDDKCTHGVGSLSEGKVEGHKIICAFHRGAFDIPTGEVLSPPCVTPVRTYKALETGGKIYIADPHRPKG